MPGWGRGNRECWIKVTGHRHTPEVTPDTRGCQTYKTPPPHSHACTVTHWPHTHNWVFICTPWSKHPLTYPSAGAGTRGPSSLPALTAMPSRVRAPLVDLRLLGHSHRAHSRPSPSLTLTLAVPSVPRTYHSCCLLTEPHGAAAHAPQCPRIPNEGTCGLHFHQVARDPSRTSSPRERCVLHAWNRPGTG